MSALAQYLATSHEAIRVCSGTICTAPHIREYRELILYSKNVPTYTMYILTRCGESTDSVRPMCVELPSWKNINLYLIVTKSKCYAINRNIIGT